jgi:hypothetical protein
MGDILGRAIADGLTTPEEVIRHVPPAEWVKDAPPNVVSEMLAAGLSRGNFDAKLALEHLTPELMAEHLSPPLVWACIADAVAKTFNLGDANKRAGEGKSLDSKSSSAIDLKSGDKSSRALEQAAASMSASKLEAMVVRKSPLASRKEAAETPLPKPALGASFLSQPSILTSAAPIAPQQATDAESWEAMAVPIGEEEVVEETTPGPPEPPRAQLRR